MSTANIIKTRYYESPYGVLVMGAVGERLCLCDWLEKSGRSDVDRRLLRMPGAVFEEGTAPVTEEAMRQLDEYFAGRRREFDVPLLLTGTCFQQAVWNELLKIPFGTTLSYGEVAQRTGYPKAVRAAANAIGSNAISIFIPCHRVIGSDRSMTGYRGGLEAKRLLLRLEGAT
ncbi:MAG: methylated-DNA--[protein]-cysteine S-methyltransferase [Prevotella sp.]